MKVLLCSLLLAASPLLAADVPALLKEGDALVASQKVEEALPLYLAAEKEAPENAEILQRISAAYGQLIADTSSKEEKLKLGEASLSYATRAVEADPNNPRAQIALAIAYGRLAELVENAKKMSYAKLIKEHAEKAYTLDPKNDVTCHVLGAWHHGMASLNPFLRAIATTIFGKLPEASNDEAERYLTEAVTLKPDDISHRVELGRILVATGKPSDARLHWEKAASLPPTKKGDQALQEQARELITTLP